MKNVARGAILAAILLLLQGLGSAREIEGKGMAMLLTFGAVTGALVMIMTRRSHSPARVARVMCGISVTLLLAGAMAAVATGII